MNGARSRGARHLLPLALFSAVLPAGIRAQGVCNVAAAASAVHATPWQGPLARTVTVRALDVPLREALERVAQAAGIRLSYSSDLVPLERRVCVSLDSTAAGDVLSRLLRGTSVAPVIAGTDLVVLAPVPARLPASRPPLAAPRDSVVPLEPVVVNAKGTDPARGERPFVTGVLEGRELAERSEGPLAQVLNTIPGLWVWGGSAPGLTLGYASVRGASSFGLSAPKVYIDGIEVANPLLLTRISPDAIERIEVIRGPQGAALFGADAISGVTSITTRHDSPGSGAARMRLRSGLGLSATDFVRGPSLAQEHSVGLRLGSSSRSAAIDVQVATAGEFIPGASSRHVGATGSLRLVGSKSIITGTLRFVNERIGSPGSPLLPDSAASVADIGTGGLATSALASRQFTAGLRASWAAGARWTHTVVAGVDGYTISGLPDVFSAILSPADSALRAAGDGALRTTLRVSSAAGLDLGDRATGTFTLAAEHTELRQFSDSVGSGSPVRGSTGISAQADVALRERLFLTGGLRLEHNSALMSTGMAVLPMLGGSWLAKAGPATVKLRAAWGQGIRWPDPPALQGRGPTLEERLHAARLGPEVQSGVEGGFDVSVGSFDLHVTRFDQTASGLVQRVAVGSPPAPRAGGANDSCVASGSCPAEMKDHGPIGWRIQSLGVIANRGWEVQSSLRRGALALDAGLSLVDSRVRRLAVGYAGDLRTGDRMLGVPARTYSLSAAWTAERWSAFIGAYGAADWVNYDGFALSRAASESKDPLVGPRLRDFWRTYEGVPHLRAGFSRDIGRGLRLMFTADNLLDRQLGEPDNVTVQPGRTLSFGIRADF